VICPGFVRTPLVEKQIPSRRGVRHQRGRRDHDHARRTPSTASSRRSRTCARSRSSSRHFPPTR
jgi:hypothetical protein